MEGLYSIIKEELIGINSLKELAQLKKDFLEGRKTFYPLTVNGIKLVNSIFEEKEWELRDSRRKYWV